MNYLEIEIDYMKESDIYQMAEIERLTFKSPWSENAFLDELNVNNDTAVYVVIRCDDKVIAYGGMWCILDEAYVTNIAVHPDFRGQGLGRKVTSSMLKVAALRGVEKMTLEVRVSNDVAINLYSSLGFKNLGRRPNFYEDCEDAYIMWNYDILQFKDQGNIITPETKRS